LVGERFSRIGVAFSLRTNSSLASRVPDERRGKKRTWGIRTSYQEWGEGRDRRFKQTMMNIKRSKLLSRFHPRAWAACPIVGWPFSPSERIDIRVKSHRGSRIVHSDLLARFASRSDACFYGALGRASKAFLLCALSSHRNQGLEY
jgi:hypothetical protein